MESTIASQHQVGPNFSRLATITYWTFFLVTLGMSAVLLVSTLSAIFLGFIFFGRWFVPGELMIWMLSFLMFPWVIGLLRLFQRDGTLKPIPFIALMLLLGSILVVITYLFFNFSTFSSEVIANLFSLPKITADIK